MFAGPLGRSTFTPPKSSFDSPLYGLVSLRRSQLAVLNVGFKNVGARHAVPGRDSSRRLPTYSTLGDVHELLPRAMAAGAFASSTAAVVRNAAQPHLRLKGAVCTRLPFRFALEAADYAQFRRTARRARSAARLAIRSAT